MHDLIQSALETAVEAALPGVPMKRENIKFKPVEGEEWARVTHILANTEAAALGSATVEYNGYTQVDILVPADTGPGRAGVLAQQVESALPTGASMTVGSDRLHVRSCSRGTSLEEPVWYTVPVRIHWRLQHLT